MKLQLLVVLVLLLGKAYEMVLHLMAYRSVNNPTPANVADVYDAEAYEKWKRYNGENARFAMVRTVLSTALTLVLLLSGAFAAVAALFPQGVFWQLLAVVLTEALADAVLGAGLNYYDTMVIEQKYGFNRSSVKTFAVDQIRNLLMGIGLNLLLTWLLAVLHGALGDGMILLFAGAVFCIVLLISFLYPYISRLGNKFTPLEEGKLKTALMALLTKHGYQVKAIEVMDASRRTTKLNAYFTGFGKLKTIVLYDNLVNAMSPEEICAVFAHELGHGLHKDVLKQQTMNLGNILLMAVTVWLMVRYPELHRAFGFAEVNYGFANVLLGTFLGLVNPLSSMAMNAYSRFAEYRADRQAVQEGYGPALVTALKKLARENFAHLSPSKAYVVLEYSHPPLSQRIEAVEKVLQ